MDNPTNCPACWRLIDSAKPCPFCNPVKLETLNTPNETAGDAIPKPKTLGEALDMIARSGLDNDAATMHAASDYAVQSRAYSIAVQDNASRSKLAKTDALLVKVAAELMQTTTAHAMLDLVERTAAMHPDVPRVGARSVVFASFRRVMGMPD